MIDMIAEIVGLIKNKQYLEAQKRIDAAHEQFCCQEVQGRRDKLDALNKSLVQINTIVCQIEQQYNVIKGLSTEAVMGSLDRYLSSLKRERNKLLVIKKGTSKTKQSS